MAIKRQPTIKTLLLMTAVIAVQVSTFPKWSFRGFWGVRWEIGVFVIAIMAAIWLLPLVASLLVRRVAISTALCLIVGLAAVFIKGLAFDYIIASPQSFAERKLQLAWAIYLAVGTPVQVVESGPFGPNIHAGTHWALVGQIWWITAYALTACGLSVSCRPKPHVPVEGSRRGVRSARRWLEVCIPSILIITLAAAFGLAWHAYRHTGADERDSAHSIWRAAMMPEPLTDQKLFQRLAKHPDTDSLYLEGSEVTEEALKKLKGHTQLTLLSLGPNLSTDRALVQVAQLTQIERLYVDGPFTNAGLAHLGRMTWLEELAMIAPKVTDAGMAQLDRLTQLQELTLDMPQVTDVGLTVLDGFTNLQILRFYNSPVSDECLAHVKKLTKLHSLHLENRLLITDKGLAHLQGLTKLRSLDLSKSQITDAGLPFLKSLVELRGLDLGGTGVTDDGLAHLRGLSLKRLILTDTDVTDACMIHVKQLADLKELDLTGTMVTDASIVDLKEMTGLTELLLGASRLTDAGVAQLKLDLPGCDILHFAIQVPSTDSEQN